ncbi:MAG: hypothetical protein UW92_C0017G0001 [Candidatus Jorgensenbacteria bacterium GW2011_GWA2_45_13]|uniref:Uncharacterized protein n=1 Tax=Candidatus Jorgensenbacteria bacterium GW2011_GWA2_45_13 TaxID=1618662 RepID=A0A0G1L5U6_9BACT|nr:MAG: hypothetical protein UW92_C0017G0001 [Candidatus Jorgensenbacteria bacterium GW2011_GWA2_45_13]
MRNKEFNLTIVAIIIFFAAVFIKEFNLTIVALIIFFVIFLIIAFSPPENLDLKKNRKSK